MDFDIEICLGAGAYICGEESALIESLEGKAGIPRNRPPYPVTQGYLGKPTVVNNVETFLAAAAIAVNGGDWFANVGTEKSKGTKILSISGDCLRPGIYEYPFGTTIQAILNDCGADDVLGVQVGGPSGTFISNQEFDRKLAFEDLATGGSFIIFNNSRNILDIVNNFTHFFAHESCGFCTPCRVGTSLLKKQLDKIVEGHGSAGDVVALEELCQMIKNHSHCGLGQTAANPVLTTLERYPELYQSRLKKISYEPGFDLDGALETARRMANRNDAGAHLAQVDCMDAGGRAPKVGALDNAGAVAKEKIMSKTITIDGKAIPFEEGQTIMEAATAAGVYIPHLCHHPDFTPHGSCKLCTVKVNGRICSACTFPAVEGQDVLNNTKELNR